MSMDPMFSFNNITFSMADVQHVEVKHFDQDYASGQKKGDLWGCQVITRFTHWDMEADCWDNPIWLNAEEARAFLPLWNQFKQQEYHTNKR